MSILVSILIIMMLNPPINQLMYDRINNWINDLNARALDDDTITTDTNCNYFTIGSFQVKSSRPTPTRFPWVFFRCRYNKSLIFSLILYTFYKI